MQFENDAVGKIENNPAFGKRQDRKSALQVRLAGECQSDYFIRIPAERENVSPRFQSEATMSKAVETVTKPLALAAMILPLITMIPSQVTAQGRTAEQVEAFRAIIALEDPGARIEAVEDFIQKWPDSGYLISCLQVGLRAAAEIDPGSDLVVEYAERYIEAYTSRGEALAYAYAASRLTDAGARTDKANEYITRALELAGEVEDPRIQISIYLTAGTIASTWEDAEKYLAMVMELMGDIGNPRTQASFYANAASICASSNEFEQAINYQKRAIEINPAIRNAGVTLANYLTQAGRLDEAEEYLIEALIQTPEDPVARESFDDLVSRRTNVGNMEAYQSRVIGEGADRMLAASEDLIATKQMLAVAFAKLGVFTDRAMGYADEIATSVGPEVGGAAYLAAATAVGQVRSAIGDHQGVLNALDPARMLAGPYDGDFHLARGMALEILGRDGEAIAEYFETAVLLNNRNIMARLEPLWEKVNPGRSLEEYRTTLREELESWHPEGEFAVPDDWTGKVVLAELFTGAECPPCVASDLAYDGLIAYYPRTVAAVLVHHVHIPGPDPMTNPDTEDRMKYYEGVVGGTPTSIFDGTDSSVGGGGAAAGKGKFGAYGWTLEQHLAETPAMEIDLKGDITGDEITMSAKVSFDVQELRDNENLRLRVVLAEELLHYEGSNGVAEHRMVVRAFLGGHDGYALRIGRKTTEVKDSLDLAVLQSDLLTYLNDWESENSDRFRSDPGFSRKMHEMDLSRLLLVAFVQNDETKQVYQTRVLELR